VVFVGRVLNFFLNVAAFNCFDGAAHFFDAPQILLYLQFNLVGEIFYVVGAAHGVCHIGDTGFERQ
jgi:hypothetical protein